MVFKRKYSYVERNDFQRVQNLLNYRSTAVTAPPDVPFHRIHGNRNSDREDEVASLMMFSVMGKQTQFRDQQPAPSLTVSQEELRKVIDKFVEVYERLDTSDDAMCKPNYTYTELIFLAIMRSPNFCLPINEIYRYIETRFAFFQNCTRKHWKNAVRHSLSKTKCFAKIGIENQKQRNGILNRSSFLWTVLPKSILNFARGDYRNCDKGRSPNLLRDRFHQSKINGCWEQCVVSLANRIEALRYTLNNSFSPARIFQLQICNIPESLSEEESHFSAQMTSASEPELGNSSPGLKRRKTMTTASTPSADDWPIKFTMSPEDFSFASTHDSITSPGSTDSESFHASRIQDSSVQDSSIQDRGYDSLTTYTYSPESSDRLFQTSPYHSPYPSAPSMYQRLPEVLPGCIYSIPEIPELPRLPLCFDGAPDQTCTESEFLPYFADPNVANTSHFTNCMFENNLKDFSDKLITSTTENIGSYFVFPSMFACEP